MKSEPVCLLMPLDTFTSQWPRIQRELDKVVHVWEPWYTKQHIFQSVLAGQFQVWAAGWSGKIHLFLFTQIVFYPAAKVLQGTLILGNSLDVCRDAIWAAAEQFARENECTRIEILGRRGWERTLADLGFRTVNIVMSVPVNDTKVQ